MKIHLHPDDSARFGIDQVIEFDPTRLGLREAAALQRATGLDPEGVFKAMNAQDLEALAALVWIVVGRAAGKRPDWDTFDVNAAIIVEDDEGDEGDVGKDETTSSGASVPGSQPSHTTTESDPGSSTA